jgi:hypothetical protein
MTYDKDKDLLGMYRYKCGETNKNGSICRVKFLDKPSIILHKRMMHGVIVRDKDVPRDEMGVIRSITIKR